MELITNSQAKIFYQVFLDKDSKYEGMFFVGIKTTGVFCRPTCPARKPKFENCKFFNTAQDALLASFRPCMRCYPLSLPGQASPLVQTLVEAIEINPEKRWRNYDFEALSVDASTVRRQFKKRFGMTFVAYARAKRMGLAIKQIQKGQSIIATQLDNGYESSSGFRDAFTKVMGAAPTKFDKHHAILKSTWIDTQLGPMLAIADEAFLYLLEFVDQHGLESKVERLRTNLHAVIIPGHTQIIQQIEFELKKYFEGSLKEFKTPIQVLGSPFQQLVWRGLMGIPYGQTRSYGDQARALGKETAYRAVASANGANKIAIVIPCHRIINSNGELGGYSGGIHRKKWLIAHEKQHQQ
jgi:AraC family transcriptional regulator of adaptative response/methylated-DNA-[protein]-cysteine methyltransferase